MKHGTKEEKEAQWLFYKQLSQMTQFKTDESDSKRWNKKSKSISKCVLCTKVTTTKSTNHSKYQRIF